MTAKTIFGEQRGNRSNELNGRWNQHQLPHNLDGFSQSEALEKMRSCLKIGYTFRIVCHSELAYNFLLFSCSVDGVKSQELLVTGFVVLDGFRLRFQRHHRQRHRHHTRAPRHHSHRREQQLPLPLPLGVNRLGVGFAQGGIPGIVHLHWPAAVSAAENDFPTKEP